MATLSTVMILHVSLNKGNLKQTAITSFSRRTHINKVCLFFGCLFVCFRNSA